MKYIYGPVRSRRLGLSLGISLTPHKVCTFDCVYCQIGTGVSTVSDRKEYIRAEEILEEIRLWLENNTREAAQLNYITFSGAGEPTLNSRIGGLIKGIRGLTNVPVAVITNASLLNSAQVRSELLQADLVVPSLDAVTPEIFARVNRPKKGIKVEDIINGLIAFRKEFKGKIWLEIMLVKGINDGLDSVFSLKDVIDKINPDKINLNSPVRATAQKNIAAADEERLCQIREILGDRCQIV
ncbi:MAG: radical SAM protein [Candidatus Omnitrophota bacterium]|jgi:wyosine [tRNA(Phe)-imidazoG37] synthetase (radical SAM superfamily)